MEGNDEAGWKMRRHSNARNTDKRRVAVVTLVMRCLQVGGAVVFATHVIVIDRCSCDCCALIGQVAVGSEL